MLSAEQRRASHLGHLLELLINLVTQFNPHTDVAGLTSNMKTEIYDNYSAFLAREDKTINGETQSFADANPSALKERGNEGCWNCSGCSGCSGLIGAAPTTGQMVIPTIPNIHTAVAEAVSQPNALDMYTWHICETTHCRAGWVVTLAGPAGKTLEKQTSTEFAAKQIYAASSAIRVSPVRFYETTDVALADIKRCAAEEAAISTGGPLT